MNAANDDNWQVLTLRARNNAFDEFERATIQEAIAKRTKRAEAWGTLYLCFAGVMLGGIVGLFIRGV